MLLMFVGQYTDRNSLLFTAIKMHHQSLYMSMVFPDGVTES